MAMRSYDSPRRVYKRNGVVHIIFAGKQYAPTTASEISLKSDVRIEVDESDAERSQITVKQRRVGKTSIVETWTATSVPVKHRETSANP